MRTADEPTDATTARALGAGGDARRVLDRYRLARQIGSGGFGVVWLAEDERLERAVAVKRIAMHDDAVAARAEREARAAARLSHPGIVALYESGRDDEAFYLVSELVRGRTLAELMRDGELSDRDVLRVGVALCDALAHAHGRGVIHRDVKPGNVIVPDQPHDGAGVAKLTDFGVARMIGDDALTITGDVVGTLAYMAPEQAAGGEVGEEADLYALALVLYEALSGVNPVRGRGAAATARRVGARLPALGRLRRDLPLELCRALDRAVLARPEQRGTLADLRAALADGLPVADDERGTIAGSPLEGLAGPAPRPRVRPRARVAAALCAGALAAAALAWLTPAGGFDVAPAAGAAAARAGRAARSAPGLDRDGVRAGGMGRRADGAGHRPGGAADRRAPAPRRDPVVGAGRSAAAGPGRPGGRVAGAGRPGRRGRGSAPRSARSAAGGWRSPRSSPATASRSALRPTPRSTPSTSIRCSRAARWPSPALWALAALALPVVVRGRVLAADVVGATAWAAALGSATQAVAGTLSWQPTMRGLVAGAVVAGGLAVAFAASRGEAYGRSAS